MNYSKIISTLGLITAIGTAIAAQVSAINPRYGAWVMLAGTLAAASGGALAKFGAQGPIATGLGLIVAVSGVLAMATDVIPGGFAALVAIAGTAAAAAGKSLFGWEQESGPAATSNGPYQWALAGLVLALAASGGACAKRRDGETPAEQSTRKKAVYTAQVTAGLQGWSDLVLVLEKGSVVSRGAAVASYQANNKVLAGVDLVRQRLRDGYPSKEVIPILETVLTDLDKAEAEGLLGIGTAEGRAKYQQVIFSLRFGLNSVRAVIAATKEPSASELRATARQALAAPAGSPSWWTDATLVIQNLLIRLVEQSRMDAATAWADGQTTSTALRAANAERLR